ncbi:MAG: DUF1501 domain-containing protein [Vicinamibacterales bacterium]|nr:DUF1501 domain-containing protein [Vicinamibacterales bacterium]
MHADELNRVLEGGRSRREFLFGFGASLGSLAFSDLLAKDNPLAPGPPTAPAKAKACILLFMEGGPSHIDTFDPKPKLGEMHLQEFVRTGSQFSSMTSGKRFYVQSPFRFRRAGESGIEMNEEFVHLAGVADELCVYRGLQAESVNHPTALYHMNTGNRFGGDPAIGAWVNYGLGSLNANLPGYVVMTELAHPQGGSGNWTNGFLPATYQGMQLRAEGAPILDLEPPAFKSRPHQRRMLDALKELNREHADRHPEHSELAARMSNYELAFRMQMEVPGILDVASEPEHIRAMYGLGEPGVDAFARKCLLARRLVENGVRFIHIFSGGWDSHDYLERSHRARIRSIDKPIAALIADLRARGLLDETLIVWCGEFGRTPDNSRRGGGIALGRDHNAEAMSMFLAGGGVKKGHVIGATDEIGMKAVEVVRPIKDLHVTLLHLLGLDDNKLTYFHGGRYKQLSQTGGKVIHELIA